ncbi:hypothetical protein [Ochrobactrum sp. A-1]|uniref:hypothetical protein n=1 Tax=Ochrobactrum sp. A-1 TaxID=2920940 RepID=UPI001F0A9375|nr:hypothetical protein [Ochrobactrum sp. A-1]
MVERLPQYRIRSQHSEAPTAALEVAITKLLLDIGFTQKRIAALFDCNQGRIAEISRGKVGAGISYKFETIRGIK